MKKKILPFQKSKEILGGTPVFPGTRVPIQTLLDYLESGDCLDDFINDFPTVNKQQAIDLLEHFKKRLTEEDEVAA